MSRAYIVTRNGGTVTKAPINDNKIPIYANKTAMEADASNIPDGAIVFTKSDHDDVIDQMKEYIRNQNVLSDWENFAMTTTNQELKYDGVWAGKSAKDSGTNIYINDVVITGGQYGSSGYGDGLCVPFRKGDNIRYSPDSPSVSKIAYYKLRDYSDRT